MVLAGQVVPVSSLLLFLYKIEQINSYKGFRIYFFSHR